MCNFLQINNLYFCKFYKKLKQYCIKKIVSVHKSRKYPHLGRFQQSPLKPFPDKLNDIVGKRSVGGPRKDDPQSKRPRKESVTKKQAKNHFGEENVPRKPAQNIKTRAREEEEGGLTDDSDEGNVCTGKRKTIIR